MKTIVSITFHNFYFYFCLIRQYILYKIVFFVLQIATILLFAAVAYCKPVEEYLVTVKQDTHGRYKVDYNIGTIVKTEERLEDGTIKGAFSYIDTDGNIQKISYVAGEDGFLVSGNNLPVAPAPVVDTPEVRAAKLEHLALVEEFKSKLPIE